MSERKWTPGPWVAKSVVENGEWMGVAVQADSDVEILWFENDPEPDDANAHLIAAAPDLYEALEQARDTILELINARNSEAEGSDEDWVGGINAALAKARGEA